MKQTALLASPIYTAQAQEEEKKHEKRSQNWASLFSSLCFFWVVPPSHLKGVFSFACQIKLSCNQAVTLVCHLNWAVTELKHWSAASDFCCGETEPRKLYTPPTYLAPWLGFNLAETTSAWLSQGGSQEQQEHNLVKAPTVEVECEENPAQGKWQEA